MKLMTLKPKKIVRPVLTPFPEETMDFARTVAQEYREMEDGHHAQLRGFLGRAYSVYLQFQHDNEAYEKLRNEKLFWKISRQKPPKDLKTSKWVLLYVMRAEKPNARTRASTCAKILNGFARKKVRADQVPGRIKALGGVEAAYDHFLAEERGLRTTNDAAAGLPSRHRPLAPRKAGLLAARGGNDDKIQGEVETESLSESSRGAAIDGRRHMPPFDPERHLIVELEPDELEAILTAGTAQGGHVKLRIEITVQRRDANGFVHVVGELEPTDLPPDFLSMEHEEPLSQFDGELE
jgi:hypothetical protein